MGVGFCRAFPMSLMPFHHDDVCDTGMAERVGVESRKRVDAGAERAFAQHAVATDACVQHSHLQRRGRREQTAVREHPASGCWCQAWMTHHR